MYDPAVLRHLIRRILPNGVLERIRRVRTLLAGTVEEQARQAAGLAARTVYTGLGEPRLISDHELRVYSQHGEDGLLFYLFSRIGTTDRRFVEFGCADGRECNTAALGLLFGWTGLLMDTSADSVQAARHFYAGRDIRVERAQVTAENINQLLDGFGEFDLLSIDIDGNDYWVWKAIDARPRVVVIEYNASLGPDRSLTIPYDPHFDRFAYGVHGWYHGASLTALERLAAEKHYNLVCADSSGLNAFFIRDDVEFPAVSPREAYRAHASRTRVMSPDQQWAALASLPFEHV